jgi:hypothetical protein
MRVCLARSVVLRGDSRLAIITIAHNQPARLPRFSGRSSIRNERNGIGPVTINRMLPEDRDQIRDCGAPNVGIQNKLIELRFYQRAKRLPARNSRLCRGLWHVLIDQDRVAIGVEQHKVRNPSRRLVRLDQQRYALALE